VKKILFSLLVLTFYSAASFAEEDLCEFFMYCPGASSKSSGGKSLPSVIISGSLNPSTLSKIKGFGVEAVLQPNNSPGYGIVTGTGKVGALVSSSQENTFFGNRSIELDFDTYNRYEDDKRYKNNKYSFAAGFGVINGKNFALDLGFSGIYNKDTSRLNPGVGITGNLYVLTFGYTIYRDDTKITFNDQFDPQTGIPYSVLFNSPTYEETFTGSAIMLGLKLGDVFFDYSIIKTKYDFYQEDTQIKILSGSYGYKKFLFNLAFRNEESPNLKYADHMMVDERVKKDVYVGMQYSAFKHVLLGAAYNRFLLNDVSASVVLSF
jgi:hypothetical protein